MIIRSCGELNLIDDNVPDDLLVAISNNVDVINAFEFLVVLSVTGCYVPAREFDDTSSWRPRFDGDID